jgi:hypothetical protein
MHQLTEVRLARIEKLVSRPGFGDRFHRATFELVAEELTPSSFHVWVHPAYPETQLERVARTLLSRRLSDLAQVSQNGAFSEQEIGALWESSVGTSSRLMEGQPTLQQADVKHEREEICVARYVLDGLAPVLCDDLDLWKIWMETPERWVEDTRIVDSIGDSVHICTVFLGLDVGFGMGEPILFETMVFGGMCDRALYRYHTWGQAKTGHAEIVAHLKESPKDVIASPVALEARDLARRTVQASERVAVKKLIERAARSCPASEPS